MRTVSLPPFVVEALEEHLATWTAVSPTSPVFIGESGGPLGTVSLQTRFDEVRRATGLTQFTLHDLRHTCFTRLREGGMAIEAIQAQAGHAPISSTRIYLHLSADWLAGEYRRAAEAIEAQATIGAAR